jgi:hypothetical protein
VRCLEERRASQRNSTHMKINTALKMVSGSTDIFSPFFEKEL